ncbi:MAG: hypothetical protein JST33_16925 [Actinobacteria bacterium]|nr:hypothetical protein [Actinomycetota bacterium]
MAGAALLALLGLAGCSSADAQRPDPTAVVKKYLAAIESGDAATATKMDDAAVTAENRDHPDRVDARTLRTDDVLSHAEQRISHVSVQGKTSQDAQDKQARRVGFTFTLDGKKTESSLAVKWDDKAKDWTLAQSLTVRLSVDAVQSKAAYEAAPFLVPGVSSVIDHDAGSAPLFLLVYPGVYRVVHQLPANLIASGTPDTIDAVATLDRDASVQFDVTELPSRAGE